MCRHRLIALYRHYVAVYRDATGGLLPDCNQAFC